MLFVFTFLSTGVWWERSAPSLPHTGGWGVADWLCLPKAFSIGAGRVNCTVQRTAVSYSSSVCLYNCPSIYPHC